MVKFHLIAGAILNIWYWNKRMKLNYKVCKGCPSCAKGTRLTQTRCRLHFWDDMSGSGKAGNSEKGAR